MRRVSKQNQLELGSTKPEWLGVCCSWEVQGVWEAF